DLRAATRRLAGTESFTIAPSKYLGHYVAGNLAARHRIRVVLSHSPSNGVTATITLPPDLLTTEPVLSNPVTPPGGQRAVRLSPRTPPRRGPHRRSGPPLAPRSRPAPTRPEPPTAATGGGGPRLPRRPRARPSP